MKLVCPDAPATGLDVATTQGRLGRGVSDEILKQAPRRLFITSLLMSGMYLVPWPISRATWGKVLPGTVIPGEWSTGDWISIASIALSLGVCAYARGADRDPQVILDIGLAYQIAIAFGLGLLIHAEPVPHGWPITPIISWIGPIMPGSAESIPDVEERLLELSAIS